MQEPDPGRFRPVCFRLIHLSFCLQAESASGADSPPLQLTTDSARYKAVTSLPGSARPTSTSAETGTPQPEPLKHQRTFWIKEKHGLTYRNLMKVRWLMCTHPHRSAPDTILRKPCGPQAVATAHNWYYTHSQNPEKQVNFEDVWPSFWAIGSAPWVHSVGS